MRIKIQLGNIDKVEATLTMKATIGEWKSLAGQLGETYPSWQLGIAISRLINRASTSYEEADEE
jgi:hypothetical protein